MTVIEHPLIRSDEQRLAALNEANRIRIFRSRLKRLVKTGALDVTAVLADPMSEVATMRVSALLMSMPKHGKTKVARLMQTLRISDGKTIGGLSERQRGELIKELATARMTVRRDVLDV